MAEQETTVTIFDVYSPVLTSLKVAGLYSGPSNPRDTNTFETQLGRNNTPRCWKLLTNVHYMYCVFNIFIVWANVVRYIGSFSPEVELTGSFAVNLFLLILYLQSAYVQTAILCANRKYLVIFLKEFHKHYEKTGYPGYVSGFRRRVKIATCIFQALAVLFLMTVFWFNGVCVVPDDCMPAFERQLSPVNTISYEARLVMIVVYTYVISVCTISSVANVLTFYTTMACLWKEFQRISEEFQRLPEGEDHAISGNVEALRLQHEGVCRLLSLANNILKHYAAMVYGYGTHIVFYANWYCCFLCKTNCVLEVC
jgi:hypothetical protein